MALSRIRDVFQDGRKITVHSITTSSNGAAAQTTLAAMALYDQTRHFTGADTGPVYWNRFKVEQVWMIPFTDIPAGGSTTQNGWILGWGPNDEYPWAATNLYEPAFFDFRHLPEGGIVPQESNENGNIILRIHGGNVLGADRDKIMVTYNGTLYRSSST
jgi:hypothetical protein